MNQSITTEVKTHKITFNGDDVFYVTKKHAKEFEERQITDKYGWYTMIRDGYEFQRQPGYGCIEELPRKQLFTYICDYGTRHDGEARCDCYERFGKKSHFRFWDFIDALDGTENKYSENARKFVEKNKDWFETNRINFQWKPSTLATLDEKTKEKIAQVL